MLRKNKNDDLVLDDYYEEDEYHYYDDYDDSNLYNIEVEDENDYENFFKVQEYDDYDDYDDEEEDIVSKNHTTSRKVSITNKKSNTNDNNIISLISKWFIRIGVVIMVILIFVFIVQWKLATLLLYILGLSVSFILGYLFMYLLMMFTDNN